MPKEVFNPSSPPETLPDGITVSVEKNQHEWNTFRIRSHEGSPKQRVLYLHGGAFVWHMLDRHWEFAYNVAKNTHSEVVLPAYPLAPEGNATSVPPLIAESLTQAIETTDMPVTLMGDSAGGNLAVVATMINRDQGGPLPMRTILISPWLDLVLHSSEIKGINAPNMSIKNLRKDAKKWRKELSVNHPQVSPVRGALHNLGNIAVFCGTADVLNPGCRRFVKKADASEGTDVYYHEYVGAGHSHALGKTAASAHARALIDEYIQETSRG